MYDSTRGATSSRSERTSAASCSEPNIVGFVSRPAELGDCASSI